MPFDRGDVVLVLFPDSNLRTAKRRPALVVQASNLQTGLDQTIVAMISSNMSRVGLPCRLAILKSSPEGQTMGLHSDSVIMADNLGGYTLSDRATYGAYRARIGLEILVEGDRRLFNPYGVIAVNPARYQDVNYRGATQLIEWLTGPAGRKAIADFRVNGEQLFFPTRR